MAKIQIKSERVNRCATSALCSCVERCLLPLPWFICCQGENKRDVCKTTSVLSGMENQVKRQRNINITNSPPLGVPRAGGEGRRRILHTFSNITKRISQVALDLAQFTQKHRYFFAKQGRFREKAAVFLEVAVRPSHGRRRHAVGRRAFAAEMRISAATTCSLANR